QGAASIPFHQALRAAQDGGIGMPPQVAADRILSECSRPIPKIIGEYACDNGDENRERGIQSSSGRKGARGQKRRRSWKWKANLFREDPRKQQQIAFAARMYFGDTHFHSSQRENRGSGSSRKSELRLLTGAPSRVSYRTSPPAGAILPQPFLKV